jgi:hypothetical protein
MASAIYFCGYWALNLNQPQPEFCLKQDTRLVDGQKVSLVTNLANHLERQNNV